MFSSFLSSVSGGTHRRHHHYHHTTRDGYETIPNVEENGAASNDGGDDTPELTFDDDNNIDAVLVNFRRHHQHHPTSHQNAHHDHDHLHVHQESPLVTPSSHNHSSRPRRRHVMITTTTTLVIVTMATLLYASMTMNNSTVLFNHVVVDTNVVDDNGADAEAESPRDGGHTIPTLLSIVHPATGKYINALENPLYEHFKKRASSSSVSSDTGTTNHDESLPKLLLDKKQLHNPNDSLTVSWTDGNGRRHDDDDKTTTGKPSLTISDDDLIAMFCTNSNLQNGKNDEGSFIKLDHQGHRNFLEVATIAQIRATSLRHLTQQLQATNKGQKSHNLSQSMMNSWYIPRFPILREKICQFVLYATTTKRDDSSIATKPATATAIPNEPQEKEDADAATKATPIAYSDIIQLYNPLTPTAIHLAFGSTNSRMVVQFTTGYYDDQQQQPYYVPVVRYGIDKASSIRNSGSKSLSSHTSTITYGTSQTYTANDMCESPANQTEAGKFYPPGMLHNVELINLEPDIMYKYQVGLVPSRERQESTSDLDGVGIIDDNDIVWSDEYTFLSPLPVAGTPDDRSKESVDSSFSYVVYGDQGCSESGWGYDGGGAVSHAMVKEATKSELPIRSVHHIGDLAYSNGAGHVWDEWFRMLSPFSTMVPLMIGVGNHEYDHVSGGGYGRDPSGEATVDGYRPQWGNFHNDSGGECGVPISKRFQMPQSKVPGSNGVFWYSYDFATVHTTVISSEHDLTPGSRQYQWLEEDLKSVNRTNTPWLVVESHRALYDRGGENGTWWMPNHVVAKAIRQSIESLLKTYQVDVVFAGHYHEYHRTCDGLYQDVCNNGGPMHITIGTGGANFLIGEKSFVQPWSAKFIQETYGYGRVTVVNASSMHFEFVKVAESDGLVKAGQVLDDVWITRRSGR